jgi:subfamily B ATP-binding cassette protein MsbA
MARSDPLAAPAVVSGHEAEPRAHRRDRGTFGHLLHLAFGQYRWPLVGLVALSTATALVTSLQPLVLAPAMDAVFRNPAPAARSLRDIDLNNAGQTILQLLGMQDRGRVGLVIATVVLYVVFALAAAGLQYLAGLVSNWIRLSAYRTLLNALFRHLLSLPMSFFVRQKTGDVVSRFGQDAVQTSTSADLFLRQGLQSFLQVVVYGALLLRTAPLLASATLALSLLHLAITRFLGSLVRGRTTAYFDGAAAVSTRVQESMLGIRIIKSFAAEGFESVRFAARADDAFERSRAYWKSKYAETPLRTVADAVAVGAVLLLAFRSMENGSLTPAGLVLFVFLARQTIAPASLFAQSLLGFHEARGSAQRLLDILATRPTLRDGRLDAPPFRDRIRLEGVGFGYQEGRLVLRDIDLEIGRGEIVAVVGPSGAGKSTLADLVLRLYDPTAGRVTLDARDVREFRQESYRSLFGVVSQEALLFNGTVEENIVYGRPVADPADIAAAARIANAAEFIERLPDGYQTLVGDRGIRLSGGQRQRIAIARAIYGQPQVLVLDEATSALDAESERLVQQAIDQVLQRRTALVIAHRLSTVVHADRIVVLRDGEIEAIGTHEQLVAANASYRRLAALQFNLRLPDTDDGLSE